MQKPMCPTTIMTISAVIIILSLIACASTRNSNRMAMEKLLTASGFKIGVADTPEKLEQLKELPQRKIIPYEEGDNLVYVYADVANCKCAYAGNEDAYQKYKELARKQQLAEEDRREAVRNKQREMDSDDHNFNRSW